MITLNDIQILEIAKYLATNNPKFIVGFDFSHNTASAEFFGLQCYFAAKQLGFINEPPTSSFVFASDRVRQISMEDREKIIDTYWSFVRHGILMPYNRRKGYFEFSFNELGISEYGKRVLNSESATPYSFDAFLKEIEVIGEFLLDELCLMYLKESLECFNHFIYLGSMFLFGSFMERVFSNYLNRFREYFSEESKQKEFEKNVIKQKPGPRIIRFEEELRNLEPKMNKYHKSTYKSWIGRINDIRIYRNDIGHIKRQEINQNIVYGHLILLPNLLKEMIKFLNELKK